jgi:hypothetical protein
LSEVAAQREEIRGDMTCTVDVAPNVVEAGAELTLRASVSCSPSCDLRGHTLLITDHVGAETGRIELTEFDGQTHRTSELVVKAPVEAGEYRWSAMCPAVVKQDVSYAEASAPIAFTVTPHTTSVVAWDIPSAIEVGARFRMKVGLRCSQECRLTNSGFGVYNHEGSRVAGGTLSGDRWPGTSALYVAEVELDAPTQEGLYTWSIKAPESAPGIPHAEGSTSFGVRIVRRPEHLVTVEAVDRESQTPLIGARVVMHPYQAVTDARGRAEVRVAKGTYKLFVSQTRYITFGLPVEVDADLTTRAELDVEPVPERN